VLIYAIRINSLPDFLITTEEAQADGVVINIEIGRNDPAGEKQNKK
jgi:hypothetical protein